MLKETVALQKCPAISWLLPGYSHEIAQRFQANWRRLLADYQPAPFY